MSVEVVAVGFRVWSWSISDGILLEVNSFLDITTALVGRPC